MLGGNDNSQVFPTLMMHEENPLPYDATGLTQMQLQGIPVGCNVDCFNFTGNFLTTTATNYHPCVIRTREPEELNSWQQRYPICFHPEEGVNTSSTILNTNPVSTGFRLCYEEGEELNKSSIITHGGESIKPCLFSLSDGLKTEMGRQKEELDNYIRIQEANMIKGIRQLGQRQTGWFVNVLERGIGRKLQEKEMEMENIRRMNKELEERIKQVSIEAQSWHYRANYNETVVNNLRSNIQQQQQQQVMANSKAKEEEEEEEGYGDSDEINLVGSSYCRSCKSKEICILLLPCRHLCLCMDCEVIVSKCPVCNLKKSASLEVYYASSSSSS
ncbi:E3 ubiquitin-protein ligase BOI-like isoform X2 [Impatiens glandulifera]|uniref:E3 ubiquitin-protein ligase BOI-like isoform X2 n=1 Tax=Impatiens glandulifera TaxID=253017 RepID=UPI001FB114F5|nr:E3 ubiquitin-protein ligase BOI-like isoform X2 [Impatiens glandulifera]